VTLTHPLLEGRVARHGFGTRHDSPPPGTVRPRQVHGAGVAVVTAGGFHVPPEADALVSTRSGVPVAVATADCVPVLVTVRSGLAVAAVHAGWRGLAAGVIPEALRVLRAESGERELLAVIGPHIGPCCYEIDAPVREALAPRFGAPLAGALSRSRPGHDRLDLGRLARWELEEAGVRPDRIGTVRDACTFCDADRFHSHRRDAGRAGRLVHFVEAVGPAT
jgi:YfiH family protein